MLEIRGAVEQYDRYLPLVSLLPHSEPLPTLEQILALEKETEGWLSEIIGGEL